MILDRLAELEEFARRATSTGAELTTDASLAEMERQILNARSVYSNAGVAKRRPLNRLAPAERKQVADATRRLKQALDVLNQASDEKLAAIASSTAERGSLRAVTSQAAGLLQELRSAQQSLLQRLADRVWNEDDQERFR
ncbi:MAG: hypothetical protein AB7V19_07215, partial [Candidatus Bipolaricaulia bacterium]